MTCYFVHITTIEFDNKRYIQKLKRKSLLYEILVSVQVGWLQPETRIISNINCASIHTVFLHVMYFSHSLFSPSSVFIHLIYCLESLHVDMCE